MHKYKTYFESTVISIENCYEQDCPTRRRCLFAAVHVGQWIWLAALHIAAKGASITTSNLTIRCDACAIARALNASSPAASYASTHLAVDGTHLLTSWPQPTQPTQPSQQPAARDEPTAANVAEPQSLPSARQRRVASLRAAFTRP